MRRAARTVATFLALSTLTLPACSKGTAPASSHPTLAPMHAEHLEMMQRGGLSEFETLVLEDAWVTDEEWNQAKNLYYACMNQYGLDGLLGDTELTYGATHADQDKFAANYPPEDRIQALDKLSQITSDCSIGTVGSIGLYYFEPRNNPDGVEHIEAVRRCIAKTSFASEFTGLNDEEMTELLNKYTAYSATPELIPCKSGIYGDW